MRQDLLRFLLSICAVVLSGSFAFAQPPAEASPAFIIDTVVVDNDSIVVYSDKSWEYLDVLNFDGIMNPFLHETVMSDSNWQFSTHWHTDMCYETNNDLSHMTDTLWACVIDSGYTDFHMPVDGAVISTFKWRGRRFHYGIDLDLETGDTVRSAFSGRVRYAKYNSSGYGNLVIVRHHNGLETYYAHFSKILVSPNQMVEAGEVLGLGGETGRATGSHLHFEVRFYDNALNPEEVIDFKAKRLKDENLFLHKGLFTYRKSSSSRSSSSHSSSSSSSGSSSSVNKNASTHTIRKGDSLYKIARMYGTSIDKLCKLNGINRDTILKIGRVLKVR